jgi:ZIP family zinc transporter
MPVWVEAGLWGLLAGAALVVGAAVAWVSQVPQKVVASVMAFGAGVLISALAFDLVDEAETTGGLTATAVGFLVGAVVYVAANAALARRGARHASARKISSRPRATVLAVAPRSRSVRFSTAYRSPSSSV